MGDLTNLNAALTDLQAAANSAVDKINSLSTGSDQAAIDSVTGGIRGVTNELIKAVGTVTHPPAPLALADVTLPDGTVGAAYGSSVSATGGAGDNVYLGTPDPASGLTVNSDGTITGTPTTAGTYATAITVTDSAGATATGTATVTVA